MTVHRVSANATEKRWALQARRLESIFIAFVAREQPPTEAEVAVLLLRTTIGDESLATRRQWAISSEDRVIFGWRQNVSEREFRCWVGNCF